MKPTVLIMGAGALGKCLASLLVPHASIIIYDSDPGITQALCKGCFMVKENGRARKVNARVLKTMGELKGVKIDGLIIATKITGLRSAVKAAVSINPSWVFLPQNGLFEIGWIQRSLRGVPICRGVTTMACQATGPADARLFFRGRIYAGGEGAGELTIFFRSCGISTKSFRDPRGPIWAKLIFSAVMNPLPVVTKSGYDILSKDKQIWRLVRQAVTEGKTVAKKLGVRLAFDPMRVIERVRQGDLAGIHHRGTIYQDVLAGKPTELEDITGALMREAQRNGVKVPALNTILVKARLAGA